MLSQGAAPGEAVWFEMEPAAAGAELPRWACRAVLVEGTLFVPAVVASASEWAVRLAAAWDGVPMLLHAGHPFVPLAWLRSHYPDPDTAATCDVIEARISTALDGRGGANVSQAGH